MLSAAQLKRAVAEGLSIIRRDRALIEGVVYASANRRVVGRLVYAHHFPCQGLAEPKSDDDFGVSVQGYFRRGGEKVVGFGHMANDISPEAVKRALERARSNAIRDPDFHGFPAPVGERPNRSSADGKLLALARDPAAEARLLADISFRTLEGALGVFRRYHRREVPLRGKPLRLARKTPAGETGIGDYIVSGDNFLVTERMALAGTTGIRASDENTIVMSLVSAMVERKDAKGRGWGAAAGLAGFDPGQAGREAAEQAVRGVDGQSVRSGTYNVILGPQAATEIFSNLLLSSLAAPSLDFRLSLFNGRFGVRVASPLLSLADEGAKPGGPGSRTFTDDGYPAARVPLVENGVFAGFLANDYYRRKLLAQSDASLREKIGRGGREYLSATLPRSGFRFGEGGGRLASYEPGVSATNLVISSADPLSRPELLRRVGNGIYIGALWYTYPIAGMKAGEISGTAVADTWRIRNGRIAEPLRVNAIRIRANLRDIVKNVIGITASPRPTILWASDEITYAPEVGIRGVSCEEIRHDP